MLVGRADSGAPVVHAPDRTAQVSIASRHDAVLAAVADRPIGVDIELVGPSREPPWAVLAAEEGAVLNAILDVDARHECFLRIWTFKEAVLKALGLGLSQEPSEVAVDPAGKTVRLRGQVLPLHSAAGGLLVDGSDHFVWACVVL